MASNPAEKFKGGILRYGRLEPKNIPVTATSIVDSHIHFLEGRAYFETTKEK